MLEYKHLHLVLYIQVGLTCTMCTAAYTAKVVKFFDLPYYLTMLCNLP